MSCGRTTTRRQAHAKRRTTVFLGHTLGVPSGSGSAAVTPKGRRVAKVNAQLASLQAWEKAHPFKQNKFSLRALQQWDKKHPFTSKNSCQVKARKSVTPKKKGKRIVIVAPLRVKGRKAAKASRKSAALKAQKAIKGLCLLFA